ncbi:MAG: DUF2961 domain-containing protein [Planctomycetes bacterium]|nr:DUF2961 domain-containing protein [Planctomycetota bacterium]
MSHKNTSIASVYGVCIITVLSVLLFAGAGSASDSYFMNKAGYTLENLPILPVNIQVAQSSSRKRNGLNGDANHYLYDNHKGEKVMFDSLGPGCVKNIWATCLTNDIAYNFYFDGEKDARFSLNGKEFYRGKNPLIPYPVTIYEVAGQWEGLRKAGNCFVPITFDKRLVITTSGTDKLFQFYHVIYEKYSADNIKQTNFITRDGKAAFDIDAAVRTACENGKFKPDETDCKTVSYKTGNVSCRWPAYKGAGCIKRLSLNLPADKKFLADTWLKIKFDNKTFEQVTSPIGMLIANAAGPENMTSLPVRVKVKNGRIKADIYFPMPFWESMQVEIFKNNDKQNIEIEMAISEKQYPKEKSGYFTTIYRDGQTVHGEDWLFAKVQGTGFYVGTVQSMKGGHYWEGDERLYVDGNGNPIFNGTGSEDYYLCCFWPNTNFNCPFGGSVGDVFEQAGKPTERLWLDITSEYPSCYYRFHLESPIPFYSDAEMRIEHGADSDAHSYYRTLAMLYLNPKISLEQTDMIDVGNSASEKMHSYKSSDSKVVNLTGQYEGSFDKVDIADDGRENKGSVKFKIALAKDNKGVRLRRRIDQKPGRHLLDVIVDGQKAGQWYFADNNPFKRWADVDFEIPAKLTAGKEMVAVELKASQMQDVQKLAFNDYRYWVYCYK